LTLSCTEKADKEINTETTVKAEADSTTFKSEDSRAERQQILEPFKGLPKVLEGCSCYFGATEEDFKAETYVFASTLDKDGYAMIKGNMAKFRLMKSYSASANHSRKEYISNNYTIIIETEKTGQVDETWQQKGKLVLKHDDEEVFYIDITGECGC